jgi:hypothetical protein
MPMAPFPRIDYGGRISALRAVGTALGLPNTAIPAQNAAPDKFSLVIAVNRMNAAQGSLPQYFNLDYNSFLFALNALAAKVP